MSSLLSNTLINFCGQAAWDEMRQQAMEEKLEKLGVERGSGSTVPHIYAPHARAASVLCSRPPKRVHYSANSAFRSLTLPIHISYFIN